MAKRPVPKYDFKAFGAAIKAARTGRKESRKKVSDEMFISPRYLANIENKGQHPSLQIFFELMLRYNISVDQFLLETPPEKNTQRRQLDALLDGMSDTGIRIVSATAKEQAAKTMNFLTENKIEQYADLLTRIEEIATASEQAGDSLKEVEKRLSDMALLIKNVTTYQKTKPLYEAYRKARNKEKYRAEHERGIILHEAAAKALKAAQIGGKLPSVPALQAEYEKLQAQEESLYANYGKLKKQVQEYDIIKRNIDSILQTEKSRNGKGRQSADKNTKRPGRGSFSVATAPRFSHGCRDWFVTQ